MDTSPPEFFWGQLVYCNPESKPNMLPHPNRGVYMLVGVEIENGEPTEFLLMPFVRNAENRVSEPLSVSAKEIKPVTDEMIQRMLTFN
jgi:hypothetical protein